jgi:hypothetical protein
MPARRAGEYGCPASVVQTGEEIRTIDSEFVGHPLDGRVAEGLETRGFSDVLEAEFGEKGFQLHELESTRHSAGPEVNVLGR